MDLRLQQCKQENNSRREMIKTKVEKVKRAVFFQSKSKTEDKQVLSQKENLYSISQFQENLDESDMEENLSYLLARVAEIEKLDKIWRQYSSLQ